MTVVDLHPEELLEPNPCGAVILGCASARMSRLSLAAPGVRRLQCRARIVAIESLRDEPLGSQPDAGTRTADAEVPRTVANPSDNEWKS
jgi:hypothetical protein